MFAGLEPAAIEPWGNFPDATAIRFFGNPCVTTKLDYVLQSRTNVQLVSVRPHVIGSRSAIVDATVIEGADYLNQYIDGDEQAQSMRWKVPTTRCTGAITASRAS